MGTRFEKVFLSIRTPFSCFTADDNFSKHFTCLLELARASGFKNQPFVHV